jgi:cytochrome P450
VVVTADPRIGNKDAWFFPSPEEFEPQRWVSQITGGGGYMSEITGATGGAPSKCPIAGTAAMLPKGAWFPGFIDVYVCTYIYIRIYTCVYTHTHTHTHTHTLYIHIYIHTYIHIHIYTGGTGKHQCPGVPLAELCAKVMIAKWVQKFETWSETNGAPELILVPIKIPKDSYKVALTPRSSI